MLLLDGSERTAFELLFPLAFGGFRLFAYLKLRPEACDLGEPEEADLVTERAERGV